MTEPTRLWGARFRAAPAPELMALSRSDPSHFRLAPYDLAASAAHARELVRAGILTAAEGETVDRRPGRAGARHRRRRGPSE